MGLEQAWRKRLVSATAVSGLVGDRVGPRLVQGEGFPSVTFGRVSTTRVHAMGADPGLEQVRMQTDSWGETYLAAKSLAEAVKTTVSRFRGTVTGETIQDVLLVNEIDLEEERGEDSMLHRVSQDYYVWHEG